MDFSMEDTHYRGIPTVLVSGDVGALEGLALRDFVLGIASGSVQGVIVEFMDVNYAEAESLFSLAELARSLHTTGQEMAVVCKNDNILRLFDLYGPHARLSVFDDLDSAAEYLWRAR